MAASLNDSDKLGWSPASPTYYGYELLNVDGNIFGLSEQTGDYITSAADLTLGKDYIDIQGIFQHMNANNFQPSFAHLLRVVYRNGKTRFYYFVNGYSPVQNLVYFYTGILPIFDN